MTLSKRCITPIASFLRWLIILSQNGDHTKLIPATFCTLFGSLMYISCWNAEILETKKTR